MTVGSVILNYNDSETTLRLINHISSYKSINNIVIVDNASTDNSYETFQKFLNNEGSYKTEIDIEKIDLIRSAKNGGYACGNNLGAKHLIEKYGCDIIIITNPDILFDEKLVIGIVTGFENNPEYALLAGIMCNSKGDIDRAPYRDIYTYRYDLADCFVIGRWLHKKRIFKVSFENAQEIMPVAVIQGSFWAVKADTLESIGYMDENTFLYYEEMILAKKLETRGLKSGLVNVPFYHYHAVSISKNLKKVKAWKINLQSKKYYQRTYNGVSGLRYVILNFCCILSVAEKYILAVIQDTLTAGHK